MLHLPASRRAPALLLALLLAFVGVAASAGDATAAPAKKTQKKAMWGPVQVGGVSQFPAYRDLGVGIFQYPVVWSQIAPTRPADGSDPDDPAYRWPADLDLAVQQGKKYEITIAVRVSNSPNWVNGGRGTTVLPTDNADFTKFLRAIGRRYPTIRIWEIWEEPNFSRNLELQSSSRFINGMDVPNNRPLTALQRTQIGRYATLVDDSYASLKAANAKNLVVGGNLTSCGSVAPQRFMQGMQLANGKPARMDLFGINPYSARRPDLSLGRLSAGCVDFGDLDVVSTWTKRYLSRDGAGPKRLFVSEYSEPTSVPSYLFGWHVTPTLQADYITEALKVVRRDKRFFTFGWYSYADLAPNAQGVESRVGLVDAKLRKKKGYEAFKRG